MGKFLNLLAHLFFAVLALALFLLATGLAYLALKGYPGAMVSLALMGMACVAVGKAYAASVE